MPTFREQVSDVFATAFGSDDSTGCGCRVSVDERVLTVDATDCDERGDLATSRSCRAEVISVTAQQAVDSIRVTDGGLVRAYDDSAVALLLAAGRFAEAVEVHDSRLSRRAARDPLGAAHEAVGRADATARIVAETGLADVATGVDGYQQGLSSFLGPTVSKWRVRGRPPEDGQLTDVRDITPDVTVRQYECDSGVPVYHLDPLYNSLSDAGHRVLAAAYERLARGEFEGVQRAPGRAVRAELSEGEFPNEIEVTRVVSVLQKHTTGYGLLADLFADERLSDVFVTAPATDTRLRVTVDDETLVTNIRLTEDGVAALSSRFRRESCRSFSRANPTLDATVDIGDRSVRVAGVTEPASDGAAFAFRTHDREVWTLPALVDNGTLTAAAAALLSVAVERGRSLLIAGPRGAGKTTLLGALLWELPPAVRTVTIEDTPELPVEPLQSSGRDVQALRASDEGRDLDPAETLRTALRLGDGALVVGEVRGEEASVLYEAMRVGANSEAVLGTVHGDGADDVYERVVTDLGVARTAFGVTDLVVTLEQAGGGKRQLRCLEEVTGGENLEFNSLFERDEGSLSRTGRIERGRSTLVESLSSSEETYTDVRETLAERERLLSGLAANGSTDEDAVTETYAQR